MKPRARAVVLILALSVLATAPGPATAGSETLHLRGGGVPITVLSDEAPTSSSIRNFDWLRNDDPGVTLKRGGSATGGSSSHYQDFLYDPDGADLSGGATLRVWSAAKDFDPGATGALEAFLLDCSALATDCQVITSGSAVVEGWSASGDWVERTIALSAANHTFDDNRRLKLRIIVGSGASADMWIAYDSVITPSSLTLDLASAPPATTTTTSTSTTTSTTSSTTTTTAPTTTTSRPEATTSTGQPDGGTAPTTSSSTSSTAPTDMPSTTAPPTDDDSSTTTSTTVESTGTASTTPPESTTPPAGATDEPATGTGGSAPASIDRGALVVTNSVDTQVAAPVVRVRIGPLEQLAVTFGTAAATIRSTFVPALALGAFGALLVITLFEQARRDWLRRATTLLLDIPQTFQRMWIVLRSRATERT